MARLFADLHCHPTMYAFNRMRHTSKENQPELFHPWSTQSENLGDMAKGLRANAYAQSDMAKLAEGGVRVVFASITPIEKGFLVFPDEKKNSFLLEAVKFASGTTLLQSVTRLLTTGTEEAIDSLTGILKSDGPARLLAQKGYLRYSMAHLKFMSSPEYDYWREFLLEYDFYRSRDGVACTTQSKALGEVSGRYHLVDSAQELAGIIEDPASRDIAIILTIEGGHTFTMGTDGKRVPDRVIFERIEQLQQMPIFFITLAHHFDNGVCGHAHSIPDFASSIIDQTERMHQGLEPAGALGARVIRALLGLDDDLKETGKRRILIDAKHMSALSRRQYYDAILIPYNERALAAGEAPIPLIFSHIAYSGIETLGELIDNASHEDDSWHSGSFYAWNINCAAEEVRLVHRSKGLLGIVFEQRIAGVTAAQSIPEAFTPDVAIRQILAMVDVVMLDDTIPQGQKITIWDCLCLGTDYDGLIDPITCYPTALDLGRFAQDLEQRLTQIKHTRQIAQIGVATLMEKICWKNAYDVAARNLPGGSH